MNPTLITWFETLFNIAYLAAIWTIVILMSRWMHTVSAENRRVAGLVRVAFILLAAGDTGHVGFRVLATLLGGQEASVLIVGSPMKIIGLGTLMTSYTVTLFYMLLVYVWRARYQQGSNWLTNLLLAAGVFRLMFMALPGNEWGSLVPPQPMSIYRNIPLLIQGVGILALILYSATKTHDNTFQWIGWMIFLSFAFYTPVILLAQQYPMVGMLMIPKTCAYLAVAWIAYRGLWNPSQKSHQKAE